MPHDPLADFDAEILAFLETAGIAPDDVQLMTPSERDFGERATSAAFRLAKERRQAPRQIAQEIAERFSPGEGSLLAAVEPAGTGFLNFRLDYATFVPRLVRGVRESGVQFGRRDRTEASFVVVEHTSVNPNKEWHVGHVRNAVLGDVVVRILGLYGDEVQVQNYIDDTGIQAAQAILGLTKFPETRPPGEKFDHYSGRLYVKIASELGSEKALRARLEALGESEGETDQHGLPERTTLEAQLANIERLKADIMRTSHEIEHGEYHPLIEQILNAQLETAFRLAIFYDLLNWESHLVESGLFKMAVEALEQAPKVSRPVTGRYAGALVIETHPAQQEGDEPKAEVLIRSNGLPTYVGKDIAYHMWKFGLLPERLGRDVYCTQPDGRELYTTTVHGKPSRERAPDRIINIIGVDQTQAQATVKEALRAAGYPREADDLFHLAYGLVTTKEGKISGRKGTAAAGDTIIDEAVRVAHERVTEKRSQDLTEDEMRQIAEAVGVGAVRYFMVQYNPMRDIVFDVADVVSYDGNTALYIQYALVRAFAILRRAQSDLGITDADIGGADATLLQHEQEKRLAFHMAQYPSTIADTSRTLAVNLVAEFAFDLATIFAQFYRDCGVLNAAPDMRLARLLLVRTVRDVLSNACNVLGVPIIERL